MIGELNITSNTRIAQSSVEINQMTQPPALPRDLRTIEPTTELPTDESIFDRLESNVRSYCRSFPTTFASAVGSTMTDTEGRSYIDFFAGAGALNYGHNHPRLKQVVIDHLMSNGLTHALDLHTTAKATFLETFEARILKPRGLEYRIQFTGPTGTNAVEAALKVARKATGRQGLIAFRGGYHGHSLGSLAATANRDHRAAAGVALTNVTFLPFPSAEAPYDVVAELEEMLTDTHSGLELPAALIIETVQAEGGVIVAPNEALQSLRALCTRFGIVMIVDDIQAGCGRTGNFFSFERANIQPDIVTVSKSIGGLGLPMAIVLIKPELDVLQPADHTGTFRGNQLAFAAGAEALVLFDEAELAQSTERNGRTIVEHFQTVIGPLDSRLSLRGIGMIWGLDTAAIDPTGALAKDISRQSFADGLVIERVGRNDTALKILPALTITPEELDSGLNILAGATKLALDRWADRD